MQMHVLQPVYPVGDNIMKKLVYLNVLAVFFIVAAAQVLLPVPAQAYVYDDFTDPTMINGSLWSDRGPMSGLFSPQSGYLQFEDTGGGVDHYQILRSFSRQTKPFFVSMQYSDLQATNSNPMGSGPILFIGDLTNSVRVYEFISGGLMGFRAKSTINGVTTASDIIPTTVTSGWLGIGYNGTEASCWYDMGSGWQLLTTYTPEFTSSPFFFIEGYNEYGTALSFRADQVQVVPLPPSVLLLGSALLGLGGWRRFRKS
jgi:hypothetical protein